MAEHSDMMFTLAHEHQLKEEAVWAARGVYIDGIDHMPPAKGPKK